MKKYLIISGVFLMVGGFWIGAALFDHFEHTNYEFPSVVTGGFVFLAGLGLVVGSLSEETLKLC